MKCGKMRNRTFIILAMSKMDKQNYTHLKTKEVI